MTDLNNHSNLYLIKAIKILLVVFLVEYNNYLEGSQEWFWGNSQIMEWFTHELTEMIMGYVVTGGDWRGTVVGRIAGGSAGTG